MSHKRKPAKRFVPGQKEPEVLLPGDPRIEPDWTRTCTNCEATPVVPCTGLCGPCTFGESETADGNW